MKRLTFSEKKALAIKFIEKIKEGYRLTGPNNAFNEAMKGIEPLPIQQASIYQFIRADEELSRAYFQARDSQRKNVLSGSKHLGVEQRTKLIEAIINNIKGGMNIRGDVYRENAVVAACESLGLPVVHWATVHRWLRVEHKDLRASFKKAMQEYRQNVKRLANDYREESLKIENQYKREIADAKRKCRDNIAQAKAQREIDIFDARRRKKESRQAAKNKLHDTAACGKIDSELSKTNEN